MNTRMNTRTSFTSTSMTRVVGMLVLAGVFFGAQSALAQEPCPIPPGVTPPADPSVTAQQVETGTASLKDFALAVRERARAEELTSVEGGAYFGCLMREDDSAYRSGSTYLVTLTPDGRVYVHSKSMALSGRLLNPFIYGEILSALGVPTTVLINLASPDPGTAAQALASVFGTLSQEPDGGFDATSPVPGLRPGIPGASGYAAVYLSAHTRVPNVLLAGFEVNESHLVDEVVDYGDPAVTAGHVVGRRTLKAFVTEAVNYITELLRSHDDGRGGAVVAASQFRIALRDPNGPWRHGNVYLYILHRTSNIILFHGAFPDRFEIRPLIPTLRDAVTGGFVLPQVIEAAISSPEGGFVEYYFDDPTDDSDRADIPKVGYAREYSGSLLRPDGTRAPYTLIIGSGFYPTSPEGVTDDRYHVLHFANGDGITSEVVLMNLDTEPVRPLLYLDNSDGDPIDPETVVDVMGDLQVTDDGALTVPTGMAPLGELAVSTHGEGDLVSGTVKLIADGPIGGMLRFDLPDGGEAIVGAGAPTGDAVFPARRQEGGINTWVAIHNPGAKAMEARCGLMSAGAVLDEAVFPLEANGQTFWYIEQAFTAADTSDFAGSVRCTAPEGSRFAAIALEMDSGNGIFTTVPVMAVNQGSAEAATLNFAHFANGDGITSELVFVNLETRVGGRAPTPFHPPIPPTRPLIYFYDQEGAPIDPETVVDVMGDLQVTDDGALTVATDMAPLGELVISTHGWGDLVSGSMKVVSDGPIGGMIRFDLPDIGQAIVGAGAPAGDAVFPVRHEEGGITAGVAIHNLGEEAMEVRCGLMSAGAVLDEAAFPLEANGQTSWLIEQAFTAVDTSDVAGSLRCTAPEGGRFTVIALEVDPGNRIFTTVPVIPIERPRSQE